MKIAVTPDTRMDEILRALPENYTARQEYIQFQYDLLAIRAAIEVLKEKLPKPGRIITDV